MSKPSDRFNMMLGRAIVDKKYRSMLTSPDPLKQKNALKELGIKNPTKVQLEALQKAVVALESLSGSFSDEVGAA
jgi:hypothetical protein